MRRRKGKENYKRVFRKATNCCLTGLMLGKCMIDRARKMEMK